MKKILTLLALAVLITGCASVGDIKRDKLNLLKLNMTTEETKTLLGEPYSTETYMTKDNKTVLIINYVVKYRVRKVFPLVFSNNQLIGWGFDYYDSITQERTGRRDVRATLGIK